MKVVLLVVGSLVVVLASVLDDINERNDWLAAGLLLFSLTASTYFLAGPVFRDKRENEEKWRFNPQFVWLSIYLTVAVACAVWLWLLKMA